MKLLIIGQLALMLCFTAQASDQPIDAEKNLQQLGIILPAPGEPVANYVNAVRVGTLVFLAGKGPVDDNGKLILGKLGQNMSTEQGYFAARSAGIQLLAALKQEIQDLNKVKRIVKATGMVNATEDFTQHPEVINGFSDLMVEVFAQRGKHARAAVGMNSLPRGIAVEIDMVVELYD